MHDNQKVRWQQPPTWIAIAIFSIGLALQCIGAWQDSQTTDEAVHIASGYSYWQTGDFRLNPEHPPLFKRLAALPLFALPHLNFHPDSPAWVEANQWQVGADLIYGSFSDVRSAQVIMLLARLPMILLWGLLAWLLYEWPKQRWGRWAGVVSLAFFTFDPNWLGHGHLVTNDVAMSLVFLAIIWALDRVLERPSWRGVLAVGLLFGLAQVTKFSALILYGLVPAIALARLVYQPGHFTGRWWWRLMLAIAVCTPLVGWISYGFERQPLSFDPRFQASITHRDELLNDPDRFNIEPPLVQNLVRWSDPNTRVGQILLHSENVLVPAYSYFRGLIETANHNYWGHSAYFLGRSSEPDNQGWWYYFPLALMIKMPPLTLLLELLAITIGLVQAWRRRGPDLRRVLPFSFWTMVVPPLAFLVWSMTSHINIGVRHVFPVYVWVFPLIGSLTVVRWPWRRVKPAVVYLLACLLALTTALHAWPNTIGYFSGLLGGTRQGHRYLLDSNLDWNQDIWRLRGFLNHQRFPVVHMALFGSIPQNRVFPEAGPVLTDQDIANGVMPKDVIVMSAGQLYNAPGPFHWLQKYTPAWRIGSAIYIYDFR